MTRLQNWEQLLDDFINENRERKFVYGSFDCCLWVCDCIQVMTGVDLAEEFRGRYHSRAEALELIHEATGSRSVRKVVEQVTSAHEMASARVLYLQRGDMALIRRPNGYSLGIVALNGYQVIVAAENGPQWIPLETAIAGWRV